MRAVWAMAIILGWGCAESEPPPAAPAPPSEAPPTAAPATVASDAEVPDATPDAAVDAGADAATDGGIKIIAQAMVVTEDEPAEPTAKPKKAKKRRRRAKRTPIAKAPEKPKAIRRISPAQTIRSHYSDVHHCYARVALKDPSIKGRITLQWTIGKTGMPQAVAVIKNTLKDKSVATCLKARAKKWKFPAPGGGVQVISYPFDLRVQ